MLNSKTLQKILKSYNICIRIKVTRATFNVAQTFLERPYNVPRL